MLCDQMSLLELIPQKFCVNYLNNENEKGPFEANESECEVVVEVVQWAEQIADLSYKSVVAAVELAGRVFAVVLVGVGQVAVVVELAGKVFVVVFVVVGQAVVVVY